jgi:rod shape-determining protein MreD
LISRRRTLLIIFILLFCHLIVRHWISYIDDTSGRLIGPDFALLSIVFAGLGRGSVWGVVSGFILGIIEDSFSPSSFGVNAFVNVIAGFASGLIGERVYHHTLPMMFLLIIGLKYTSDLLLTLHNWTGGQGGLGSQLFLYSPLSSVFTGTVGILFLVTLRVLERGRLRSANGGP